MGIVGERDCETLSDLRTPLVAHEDRDECPEMLDVERVRGWVSALVTVVIVTMVIGGGWRGIGGIGDDGAVAPVGVRGRAGDVVEEVTRVGDVTL